MGKGFFTKIAELISGEKSAETTEIEVKAKPTVDNSIDKKGNLLNSIIQSLKSNYAGSGISLADHTLTLWVDDSLFYNSLTLDKFDEVLATTIIDELGLEFKAIEIKCGDTPSSETSEIMDGCHLQIAAPIQEVKTEQVTICKATISAIAGRGSIIGECVCIDSEEIKTLPNQRYNIGIGKQPFMSDGTHRDNHIAIDDDQSSVEFDKNKYVSRAHAHISYSEEHGFMLQVEQGGTQLAQKRTHIYRGGEKIALNNTLIPEPLQDGDYIVLSKNVHLLYKKA